jgi:NAD(P) transhydrogenase subunit alpha
MFSGNVTNFLLNLVKKGQIEINMDDEIIRETLTTEGGQVANGRIRELLGFAKLPEPAPIET